MAKRKRASRKKPPSSPTKTAVAESVESPEVETIHQADRFVGQWNRLISTTNWEKGRIICQWREALMSAGAAVTEYSDEAWSQLVNGVTSQHVGRLRRVFQRFGDVHDQYEGLYWSHFQAALDWDDAEMWLEGAIQNEWSVSQMRGKRWETLGTPPEQQEAEAAQDQLPPEEDSVPEKPGSNSDRQGLKDDQPITSTTAAIKPKEQSTPAKSAKHLPEGPAVAEPEANSPSANPTRLKVDVELLPDDVAEAFESFKLAIIAHRREGWRDTTPNAVVECLGALQELALQN